MIDTLSATFICLSAHSLLLFITLFDKEDILLASLPVKMNSISEESRVGFTVHLIVGLSLNIIEFCYMLRRMPSPGSAIFSVFTHTLSCLFLLKFIVDSHPTTEFWWIFAILSCPNFLLSTISMISSLKGQKIQ